ncbi:MAG: riboflavin kinase [Lentimicrobiaceae bacterium]|nr:riboflavin kinase [Lentimicrobiaceae bacterium]
MDHFFLGTVIHGLGEGKNLGFPTVNIKLNNSELDIDKGIYAVIVDVDSQRYKGMLYAGTRPTFDLQDMSIEIHIFNFNKNIYDQPVSFKLCKKIRDEIKFDNINQLIEQLHQDKEKVYKFFHFL